MVGADLCVRPVLACPPSVCLSALFWPVCPVYVSALRVLRVSIQFRPMFAPSKTGRTRRSAPTLILSIHPLPA